MLLKRIIPCLDVAGGRVVKGTHFLELRDQGDPVAMARSARGVFIPFTVGGGIREVDEIRALLRAGADKVSIQTAAVQRPGLITEGARQFGSQSIVVAIDAKWEADDRWQVYTHGGRQPSGLDA